MNFKNLYELILLFLKENCFDGLSNVLEPCDMDCCCDLDNLGCWCDRHTMMYCFPGKKCIVDKDKEDGWIILPSFYKRIY